MYINNLNIIYYVIIGLLGLLVGEFSLWCNYRMVEEKKILSKEIFAKKDYNKDFKYIILVCNIALYIAVLYKCGINENLYANISLIKYLILIPMLVNAFFIDLKHRIIPNRLNMTIFEVGLIFTFIHGLENVNTAKDMLLGMLVGGGIFLAITGIGGLIAGKEAMGFGDVKLMGALGLFFGAISIAEISILAFILGGIASIFVIIIRKIRKNKDEYVPFGPFLTLAAICMIFAPANSVFGLLMWVCTPISNIILNIIF